MNTGKTLVEQVLCNGDIIQGYDCILSTHEIFELLKSSFPNISYDRNSGIIGNYKSLSFSIRIKNITYLGNPHPINKKRIQISKDLQLFYQSSKKRNLKPLLLGIYSFMNNHIIVDFNIDDYIEKKAHNSSAHILTQDLAEASYNGFFQKYDNLGNKITSFNIDHVNTYFDYLLKELRDKQLDEQILSKL